MSYGPEVNHYEQPQELSLHHVYDESPRDIGDVVSGAARKIAEAQAVLAHDDSLDARTQIAIEEHIASTRGVIALELDKEK